MGGLSNVEDAVPVSTETRFRVGSVSKSLTSAAVGLLAQHGRLDLDAPIQKYVPSFPEKGSPITARQLGGHLSGIPHYNREDLTTFVRYESVTDALNKFKDRPLLFEPGEQFSYSSYGFNLLRSLVRTLWTLMNVSGIAHLLAQKFPLLRGCTCRSAARPAGEQQNPLGDADYIYPRVG